MPPAQKNTSDSDGAEENSVGPLVGDDSGGSGGGRQSRREIFETSFSGAREWDGMRMPLLRSDVQHHERLSRSLAEFRMQEGDKREEWLRRLWKRLPQFEALDGETVRKDCGEDDVSVFKSREEARELKKTYEDELVGKCRDSEKPQAQAVDSGSSSSVSWNQFCKYAEAKEVELWHIFHSELDLDGNGHLDAEELGLALRKAGIPLSASALSEFMTALAASPHSHAISFREFRDFLLLMPRKASTAEIYQYYQMTQYLGDDARGATRVTMEGGVNLSAEDKPSLPKPIVDLSSDSTSAPAAPLPVHHLILASDDEHPHNKEEEHHSWLLGSHAVRYLLAGGVAGAVSRTCTAPFDRLKIFLITRKPDVNASNQIKNLGSKAITNGIKKIYLENGIPGFWIGNGLATAKILPESAIKFLSYETSKRFFAQYWDHVEDPREISQMSRFFAGGISGITSQLSIYPIETVKTQMMSNVGSRLTVLSTIKHVYDLGGSRAFYRGLTIGLIGVFPYSAIDMSTFEALKIAYVKSTGKDEPGVLAILAFGSISGSVGATSVYPLNMTRTRLQASGSPGHPQRYTGIWDVASQTYKQSGIRGFYRGLGPTLAKVIPAVSISYVVYEHSKRRLGV